MEEFLYFLYSSASMQHLFCVLPSKIPIDHTRRSEEELGSWKYKATL